ncbi:hypothetical protein [Amphritea japonica]|uniref:Glycosyl transferase family 2 n=1 Tax=Amphritea japonica ATCC BAA-1530 TaxID=1278309 RepID=A0A7R6SSI8_9GAMM|nr:hypothetical protein [Amphritea japonica]BBB26311.1 glycosyl transferase family 2 [Amphritea japonica ATCC BAA-1530]
MNNISVVIPVGPAETNLDPMLRQLIYMGDASQVIFVFCPQSEHLMTQLPSHQQIKFLTVEAGRATQLNAGAAQVDNGYIWFLHLDSLITNTQWQMLNQSLQRKPDCLHYFDLRFQSDGNGPMWLNSQGANLRSRWLGLPFGDQGFCLSVNQFEKLGGYPVDAPYGEDHLFIWRAHQKRIKLANTGAELSSSARKYAATGWGRLTLIYQLYWIKQALPQLWILLKRRVASF